MKLFLTSLLVTILFSLTSFAKEETKFCTDEEYILLTVNNNKLTLNINGENAETVIIQKTLEIVGEDAQEDQDLVGEQILKTTAYDLGNDGIVGVIQGVSGTKYLVIVDITIKTILGTTAAC